MWNSVFCALLNLRYSTLIVSLVFQTILTAYSHHRFITLKDSLVVIAVVRIGLYTLAKEVAQWAKLNVAFWLMYT